MNLPTWFFCLVVGCLACSKPAATPTPSLDKANKVTALLNDSTWFGSALATKTKDIAGQSACRSNRFDISFPTDLPLTNSASKNTATGCSGDCNPTQLLGFRNIPLTVGRYSLDELNACAGEDGSAIYYWLLGGDMILDTYSSQNRQVGWIEITGYDANQKMIQGTFDIELSNQTLKTVRFQNGTFNALMK